MSYTTISIPIEEEVKKRAEKVFGPLEQTFAEVFTALVRQAITQHDAGKTGPDAGGAAARTPFGTGKPWLADDFDAPLEDFAEFERESAKGKPHLGGWEGKIKMADDFDAPLEDFAEYMR
jgi:hypothetical protein